MLPDEIENAIIESASIDDADRGMLTAWLHLDFGGRGQGFGGYTLYLPETYQHHTLRWNYAGHFIWRCMEIAGVSRWKDMPGKTLRVRRKDGLIDAVGHIVRDDWFCPKTDFAKMTDT